ncbi:Rne/Rng family ribonuclease [Comamonas sp. BIGb0152]|uniref:ribonuclease E/G n=1 Tax=Comamonas sp. BIGb0152 TaxID=2940601 RepID=UPI002168AAED|nr:ribonuclease E/G [Comamonas sp. BIGb0152]MCS4292082.1 Rne/Rng family ribonuclease [Comamonas sp. BIGb0152]
MQRILINATYADERRLAMVDGQQLLDYEIEIEGEEQRKGNIYQGVVTRIDRISGACMVDYGDGRDGLLPLKEISMQCLRQGFAPSQLYNPPAIKEGDELMVQVVEEEFETQGAILSTAIALIGRYLVLVPSGHHGNGISRCIEGNAQAGLNDLLSQLAYPQGMAITARDAAMRRSATELQRDLNYLLKLWDAIEGATQNNEGAYLIYQESNLVIRTIRDYFHDDVAAILIDSEELYEQARQFMSIVMPEYAGRIEHYQEDMPLFEHFRVADQMEAVYPHSGRPAPAQR